VDRNSHKLWRPSFNSGEPPWIEDFSDDPAAAALQRAAYAQLDEVKYAFQDWRRAEALNNGEWHMVDIIAIATIDYGDHEEEVASSVCGIESDAGKVDFEEVEQEQLAELKHMLKEEGFSAGRIRRALAKAKVEA
jgi:hypothetical protein